jgi:hypothetical protein
MYESPIESSRRLVIKVLVIYQHAGERNGLQALMWHYAGVYRVIFPIWTFDECNQNESKFRMVSAPAAPLVLFLGMVHAANILVLVS